ncbi:MAG TPA: cytochrome b/b6 domain-containing protein [Candidatus Binatia bacterium]|nr:cytochrome b/b6 domain-containing protein [Candidatus Binatia bacterium]
MTTPSRRRESRPALVRHALHHVYAATAIVLMVTGVFLTLPDLRARLIGGYGREILDLHLWAGWLLLAAPPAALLLGHRDLLVALRERLSDGRTWRRFHMASVLIAGFLLGLTGVVLWLDLELSRTLADLVSNVHEWLSWFVIAELCVHVVAAWRKTYERTRMLLGFAPVGKGEDAEQDLFEFADDD